MLYNKAMKKIMLIYPPGEIYQRGEDRCQINVNASAANSARACNDLGIISSILKKEQYNIFLKDYASESLTLKNFLNDVSKFQPDIVFISITNGSIYYDLEVVNKIKKIKNDVIIILKGALFFNTDYDLFDDVDLTNVDYLIGGEVEFIISPLLQAHYQDKTKLKEIEGICYKENNEWLINKCLEFNNNLDSIPFPDRSLMNNKLYINPLTNKTMATISTSRGCPSSCIYCISPVISGKSVRFRSVESVYEEILECVEKYDIKDFFFKSDTFTIDKTWVLSLCNLIINSKIKDKINWCANSRVNTLDDEIISKMKQAGCSLIALGIESGSEDSLKKMKKGITLEQIKQAVNLIKKYKLKIFGFYLIGFPWETKQHLKDTEKLIFELDTDFIELSIATPFKGSELYDMVLGSNAEKFQIYGKDSFKYLTTGTDFLSIKELESYRKRILLKYYLRPSFILRKIFSGSITFSVLYNYIKYGFRLLNNIFTL